MQQRRKVPGHGSQILRVLRHLSQAPVASKEVIPSQRYADFQGTKELEASVCQEGFASFEVLLQT